MAGFLNNIKNKKKTILAVLIDPDKYNSDVVLKANDVADVFFVGGSTLKKGELSLCIQKIKKISKLPIVVFPGDNHHLDKRANAMLLLSLISGRNPDYLIGKHVEAALQLKKLHQEIIPTGYVLISGGKISTTQRVTNTKSISEKNIDLIIKTAIAGELLGMKLIYLEAGSGASSALRSAVIQKVKKNIAIPLCVGGGIDSLKKYIAASKAGADIVVIGNAIEKNISLIDELRAIKSN